ncbi:HAMP domain-containing sensor histidine kinase [Paenibacillus sp. PK3_47]|uniref:sensor histidine kinase n=1 Tax=Paenibacillus sp. PK3_47 TaxID=2072642 RepID=UPI00201DF8D7|nr:HAMP domain-containing sensor histidine kinase [Paenibacillus sp. PK3_47]
MFLSLWTIGGIFLTYNIRTSFWNGMMLIAGGMASFAFSIHLVIMPFLVPREWLSPSLSGFIYQLSIAAMTIYFYIFPYFVCMGGVWHGAIRSYRLKVLASAVLAIPALVLLAVQLLHQPWGVFDIAAFRWWAGFYLLVGYTFYYLAYRRETEYFAKRNKKRSGLLFTCGTLFAFITDFVGFHSLRMGEGIFNLESNGAWKFNVVVILALVAIIIIYTVKYGFLGIKLRIERERMDVSMRALTMGVSILNHSIKNEIQKINYLAEKTESYIHSSQPDKSLQSIEQIHQVTSHLMDMVGRIKDKADDIVLSETHNCIEDLLTAVLQPMQPMLDSRAVRTVVRQEEGGELICDALHFKEMLSNLIHNAMDAIEPAGGLISLRTSKTKRYFTLEVTDNGSGIPKDQLGKIFEPFYTTKKNPYNHGLGLSYCLSVMRKHGGRLTIGNAESGQGTTVMLHFPVQRYQASAEPDILSSVPVSKSVSRF